MNSVEHLELINKLKAKIKEIEKLINAPHTTEELELKLKEYFDMVR